MEWVIQDEKHNLTLISSTGKNNWTTPIGNPIKFPIRQVDLYKNSRLQMAYTTKKGFEVIDRNARPVSPFSSTPTILCHSLFLIMKIPETIDSF